MLLENELEQDLVSKMEECLKNFQEKGANPSIVAEREYGILYALMGERMPQKYITLMTMEYYLPKSSYSLGLKGNWKGGEWKARGWKKNNQ